LVVAKLLLLLGSSELVAKLLLLRLGGLGRGHVGDSLP